MAATATSRSALDRRDLLIAAAIALATLGLRLLYLYRSVDAAWPHTMLYEGDATVWAQWAALLHAGQPFESDLAFRTPGVAWLLHWMGAVAPPFTMAKVVWCGLSAVTPAALYLVMARWFTRTAAVLAALLCALGFGSFVMAVSLNNEAPYALLVVCIAGVTLAWVDRPNWKLGVMLGVMHGVAMLLRAEHLLLMEMLCAAGAWRLWRGRVAAGRIAMQTLWVLLAAVAVCAPWSLRAHAAAERFNTQAAPLPYAMAQPPWTPAAQAFMDGLPAFAREGNFAFLRAQSRQAGLKLVDEADVRAFFEREWRSIPEPLPAWSLVSFKGSLDFALSNHPGSDGGFSKVGLSDSHDREPPLSLARPSHTRLVNHGYEVGWRFIRADPARWLRLVGEKLRRFQDGITLGLFANDWPHAAQHVRQSVDMATPMRGDAPAWNALGLALLAGGVAVAWVRHGGWVWLVVLGYRVAVIVAFYGYARHAVAIAPALCALMALALDAAWMAMRARVQWRAPATAVRLCVGAVMAGLLAVAAWTCWHAPVMMARPAVPGGTITAAPQWGEDAYEAVDAIVLQPMQR